MNKTKKNINYGYLIKMGSAYILFMTLFISTLLFVISGNINWFNAQLFIINFITVILINFITLIRLNPEVLEERIRLQKGSKRWDVILMTIVTLVIIGILAVAAIDERYSISKIHSNLVFTGVILFILGDLIILWSMVVNKWFSKLFRIQTERGQMVVDKGPYAYVRHPGYLGWIMISMSIPLILGSLLSVIPTCLLLILIFTRTYMEDITLIKELNGYYEYTLKVRYRLITGIW